jgi:hypothetical protein
MVDFLMPGKKIFKYFGMYYTLQYINSRYPDNLTIVSPISDNIGTELSWRKESNKLSYDKIFEDKLRECISSKAKFIVIYLRLVREGEHRLHGHANCLLVFNVPDGLKCIRIEPHGNNQSQKYNIEMLDNKLKEFLALFKITYIEMARFPEVLGTQNKESIINTQPWHEPNTIYTHPKSDGGLCATHVFLNIIMFIDIFMNSNTGVLNVQFLGDIFNKIDKTYDGLIYGSGAINLITDLYNINKNIFIYMINCLIQVFELYKVNKVTTRSGRGVATWAAAIKIEEFIKYFLDEIPKFKSYKVVDNSILSDFRTWYGIILSEIRKNKYTKDDFSKIFTISGIDFNYMYKKYLDHKSREFFMKSSIQQRTLCGARSRKGVGPVAQSSIQPVGLRTRSRNKPVGLRTRSRKPCSNVVRASRRSARRMLKTVQHRPYKLGDSLTTRYGGGNEKKTLKKLKKRKPKKKRKLKKKLKKEKEKEKEKL